MYQQLIRTQQFTSIQEAQAGLARLFKKADKKGNFLQVLRNNKSLGVLIPNRVWDSLIEDLEALSSESYLKEIERSRKSKRRYSAKQVKKELGI